MSLKARLIIAAMVAATSTTAAVADVYTRAWCSNPAHGRSKSGYGWISEVFVGPDGSECWKYANGHRQFSHDTGCSWVDPRTGETKM